MKTYLSALIRLVSFPILAVSFSLFAQTPLPPPAAKQISPAELDLAKKVVTAFCKNWKALKLDSIFVLLCKTTQKEMPKARFNNIYGTGPDKSGRLSSFTVNRALPNENEIVVKVNCTFAKERVPAEINGMYNFHLIRENERWKIKSIVTPISPPDVGKGSGGHPGE